MKHSAFSPEQLAALIDHALLHADATAADIERLCAEAREFSFCAVCVNGSWVRHACYLLEGSGIKVAAVAGFPLGAMSSEAKPKPPSETAQMRSMSYSMSAGSSGAMMCTFSTSFAK
jgi:deoxyribose-phosphate aldolase